MTTRSRLIYLLEQEPPAVRIFVDTENERFVGEQTYIYTSKPKSLTLPYPEHGETDTSYGYVIASRFLSFTIFRILIARVTSTIHSNNRLPASRPSALTCRVSVNNLATYSSFPFFVLAPLNITASTAVKTPSLEYCGKLDGCLLVALRTLPHSSRA